MKPSYLIIFLLFSSSLFCQSVTEVPDPFIAAQKMKRPVLLIFSGSDWCLPCIQLNKTILSDSAFKRYAATNLILRTADFPQKKKLKPSEVTANEKLAEEFNPEGAFPLFLLVNPGKTIVVSLVWESYSANDFIKQIKDEIQKNKMLKEYVKNAKLMGSAFSFIITAEDDKTGGTLLNDCIDEVKRIETLLTEFSETSETSVINKNAGKAEIAISGETYDLIKRCKDISALTGGAFDITAGVLKRLYRFKNQSARLPDKTAIKEVLKLSGYKKIKLFPDNKILLEKPGMHIGFGAIGKGYAADKVKELMITKGVKSGIINASGDLTAWGIRSDNTSWKTGVAHPDKPARIILWLPLKNLCIATSGNYEQYFEANGIRYSHNIDPQTGYPVKGVKSVSVISPAAELSDGLATAVSVMGPEAGLHLIDHLPRTHCIIIDDNNKIFSSRKINLNLKT
jgi:FAD:protein FMN transferase